MHTRVDQECHGTALGRLALTCWLDGKPSLLPERLDQNWIGQNWPGWPIRFGHPGQFWPIQFWFIFGHLGLGQNDFWPIQFWPTQFLDLVCVSWWCPEGWARRGREGERWGPMNGAPQVGSLSWGPKGRVPKISGFFFPSPVPISLLMSLSLGVVSCTFEGPGLQKHHQNSTRRHPEREKKKREILGGPA